MSTPRFHYIDEAFALHVHGPDAARYLQARLTNDIRILDSSPSMLAAILDAQGKTEGLFTLAKNAHEDAYTLIADGGEQNAVVASLLRFKVADQLEVTPLESPIFYIDCKPEELPKNLQAYQSLPEPRGYHMRSRSVGTYLLLPNENIENLSEIISSFATQATPQDALAARILGGRPVFPNEISPKRIFLESDLTDAISRNKGCYAGQEVIERASALGKLPKTLRPFQTSGTTIPEHGADIVLASDQTQIIGSVLSASTEDQSTVCFGLIKTRFLDQDLCLPDERKLQIIEKKH